MHDMTSIRRTLAALQARSLLWEFPHGGWQDPAHRRDHRARRGAGLLRAGVDGVSPVPALSAAACRRPGHEPELPQARALRHLAQAAHRGRSREWVGGHRDMINSPGVIDLLRKRRGGWAAIALASDHMPARNGKGERPVYHFCILTPCLAPCMNSHGSRWCMMRCFVNKHGTLGDVTGPLAG